MERLLTLTYFRWPGSLFPKYDYDKIYADCEPYHGMSIVASTHVSFRLMLMILLQIGGHAHAYENYGIDEEKGAVIVIRPDGCELLVTRITFLQI